MDQNHHSLQKSVIVLLADIFQCPPEEIRPDLAFGDRPEWDSLGHMNVMAGLEERYGVEISADTISELTSVPAIIEYLKKNTEETPSE